MTNLLRNQNFKLNLNLNNNFFAGKAIVLSLSLIIVLLCPFTAIAGPTVIKFAHSEAEIDIVKSPYLVYTNVFGSIIESGTAGRYKVQVFPNKQLGDLRSMAEQCSRGLIQMTGGQSAGLLSSFDPSIQVVEMPYTFQNTEIGRFVMNGWFGKELSDAIAEKSGLRIISYLPSAFRNFSNSKREIRTPADMKGLKIRTMEIPLHVEMVKALGASATPISWQELYSALQTGVVDGQENAPYTVLLGKLEEVQKFYTLDHHLLNMPLILINEKFYRDLTPADRRVFDYAAREAAFAFLGIVKAKEANDLAAIADAGVKIYQPTPAEYGQFQKATKEPILKIMKQKVDSKWIDKLYKAIDEAERATGLK
jgi:tripartite ATP-independent transporter DctP family solute receptor